MEGLLGPVPEESADCSTAAYPPRSLYRDSIRTVPRAKIRSTLFSHSQSGYSGSSYSGDSYPSNNSGCSSGTGSAAAVELGARELSPIARQMVSDGYIQRMVDAFSDASPVPAALALPSPSMSYYVLMLRIHEYGDTVLETAPAAPTHVYSDGQDRVLQTWFFELDVDWVLQIRQEKVSQWLQDNSGSSSLQDLVERWIRALTVIIHSILELPPTRREMMAVKRFYEATIFKMHGFVDAMVPALKAGNLQTALHMHTYLRGALYHTENSKVHSELAFFALSYLTLAASKLKEAISSTMDGWRR